MTTTTARVIYGKQFHVTPDPAARVVYVEQECSYCLTPNRVIMPQDAFDQWANQGAFIQSAWPQGTPSLREAVISGLHPSCWDAMLGPES